MSNFIDPGSAISAWANQEPTVSGLVLIGSRERSQTNSLERADENSDWDFHVISSHPQLFANRDWTSKLIGVKVHAYAARTAIIGAVPKVSIVFSEGEVDLVVIPKPLFNRLKIETSFGLHRRNGRTRRRLQDLAEVIRPGWRIVKGTRKWESLYRNAVADVDDPRLTNVAACQLAEGFVCDYVWSLRKIRRGELHAVQRMLYQELLEVNYKLLHELRRRRKERTFTKARRIEQLASAVELESVSVEGALNPVVLRASIRKCAQTCVQLMHALVNNDWRWPKLGAIGEIDSNINDFSQIVE